MAVKPWYKFLIDSDIEGGLNTAIDSNFAQHAASMGGYKPDEGFSDKDTFFKKFFYGAGRRKINYHHFMRKYLEKDDEILFVASGQCANELALLEDGFTGVTASDLDFPQCYDATKALFPGMRMVKYDVLAGPAPEKYDAIVSLSLVYLFGPEELDRFFSNIARSLKSDGKRMFILDLPASPPHLFARLFHHGVLRSEAELRRLVQLLRTGRIASLVKKHHGYFIDTGEIGAYAAKHGFSSKGYAEYDFRTELERSVILTRLMHANGFLGNMGEQVGRLLHMPYTRMFLFERS